MHDDSGTPVCFGAITLYSTDSQRCLACASFDDCGSQVQINLKEAARVIDVESLLQRHKEIKKTNKRTPLLVSTDNGKLKTQAPPVQRDTEQTPAQIVEGPAVSLRALAQSILLPLLQGGSAADLREALQRGENPFQPAMKEQWVLCELLLRGPVTRAVIESAVSRTTGDDNRARATPSILMAAKVLVESGEGGNLQVNPD